MQSKPLCNICHTELNKKFCTSNGYTVLKCTGCGHIQVGNLPTPEELQKFYAQGFGDALNLNEEKIETVKKQQEGDFPLTLAKELNISKDAVILDIGCSYGYDLCYFRNNGFKNLYGVEISDAARDVGEKKLGLTLFKTVNDFSKLGEKVDLVYLKHNLEHQLNPLELIQEVVPLLAPNAQILIGIPHIRSLNGLYRKYWEWMGPPVHLHYFTKSSLTHLAKQTGLKTKKFYSRRGHGLPFVKHFVYCAPKLRYYAPKWFGQPYEKPDQTKILHRILEAVSKPGITDAIRQKITGKLLLAEELWLLASKQ